MMMPQIGNSLPTRGHGSGFLSSGMIYASPLLENVMRTDSLTNHVAVHNLMIRVESVGSTGSF